MADTVFSPSYIQHGYCAMAQRAAVLWPTTGHRSLTDAEVGRDVKDLLSQWRNRLAQLRKVAWGPVQNPLVFQYMRNCSPQMATMKAQEGKHPCKRRLICPWCYARRISATFKKFASFLPEEGNANFDLLVVKNAYLLPEQSVIPGQLQLFLFQRAKVPAKLIRRLHPTGAVYTTTINPISRSNFRGWSINYSILAMVPIGHEIPSDVSERTKMDLIHDITPKRLAGAVGRAMRYPVGLLHSDPELVVQALDAQARRYLYCQKGCLRGGAL